MKDKTQEKGHGGHGQSKTHEAKRVNPETGVEETRVFTQDEWKKRNKSEGWSRDDDEAEEEPVEVEDTGAAVDAAVEEAYQPFEENTSEVTDTPADPNYDPFKQ